MEHPSDALGKGETKRKIRVLLARLGLDSHWRGAMVVARGLMDAGMEVIYVGSQFPPAIAEAAFEEDVDVVGLSSLSGNHMLLVPRTTELLRQKGLDDVLVVVGGIIPQKDIAALQQAGVDCTFGPGTPVARIVEFIRGNLKRQVE